MRTIKFRGKGFYDGRWYYGDLIHDEKLTSIRFLVNSPDVDNVEITVIPETVGQFTGLTDKNGIDIYDGDVIGRDGFFKKVIFHNGVNFSTYPVNNPETSFILKQSSIDEYDKVIGNIYDNPELLKL